MDQLSIQEAEENKMEINKICVTVRSTGLMAGDIIDQLGKQEAKGESESNQDRNM